jgi:hypothetical protein
MDFTFTTLKNVLKALKSHDFLFCSLSDYLSNTISHRPLVILRHDVEKQYENALHFAEIQKEMGIRGTYYFRLLPKFYNCDIIKQIASLGHEIGYHYDDLSHCKGNYEEAIRRFETNLERLRNIAEVKTICMEGAPLSKYDNRDLWRIGDGEKWRKGEEGKSTVYSIHRSPLTAHYSDYGIIGEPYFDLDFSKVFYLTDTGRRWDGGKFSVRDKVGGSQFAVRSSQQKIQPGNWDLGNANYSFHSTSDIINAVNSGLLPDQIMITFHPQRWTDKPLPWLQELVLQNVKNVVKRLVVSFKV